MTNEQSTIQTLDLAGRRYVVVPEEDFCRMTGEPPLPESNERGNYPAVETMRVLIARDIIRDRRRLGLSQAELARRAGVSAETVNRIERGKVTPSVKSIDKIDRALKEAERQAKAKRNSKRATGTRRKR